MTIAVIGLAAGLTIAPVVRADDVGADISKTAQDAGTAISNGAKQVGTTIEQHVTPIGQSIQKGAEDTGSAVHQKADETGTYLDRATKGFRDDTASFFHRVGNFFSGTSNK